MAMICSSKFADLARCFIFAFAKKIITATKACISLIQN
jgi:hypothetical protein